jgi:Zn-dependent protease with chaperone function
MRFFVLFPVALALSGCIEIAGLPDQNPDQNPDQRPPTAASPPRQSSAAAAGTFNAVVQSVEPIAERTCRERTSGLNCDYQIVVDSRAGQPPNAFQTVDRNGRPIIAFTTALIADVRNADELAFIMGHEAAHHIRGHLGQTQEKAAIGAVLGGLIATIAGGNSAAIDQAQSIGANVGVVRYSKGYELEADALGTRIAYRAGYNPERGAQYFTRIPDPGANLLSTHPPNASRIDTVRAEMAKLR